MFPFSSCSNPDEIITFDVNSIIISLNVNLFSDESYTICLSSLASWNWILSFSIISLSKIAIPFTDNLLDSIMSLSKVATPFTENVFSIKILLPVIFESLIIFPLIDKLLDNITSLSKIAVPFTDKKSLIDILLVIINVLLFIDSGYNSVPDGVVLSLFMLSVGVISIPFSLYFPPWITFISPVISRFPVIEINLLFLNCKYVSSSYLM